jgi:prepilin-type N-terminal cleavage/methylation domain-containing protein
MKPMTWQAKTRCRTIARGYTVVELMMALAVFGIGVSGIIAMQKVAAAANQHSRALSIATNVAQTWQDQLNLDASLSNRLNGFQKTNWLTFVSGTNMQANWSRPGYNANLGIGAAFDALGQALSDSDASLANAQFCVHVRLTRLYPTAVGIDVVRSEVRVIWPRTEGTSGNFCAVNSNVKAIADDFANYHSIYQVSAVRQQP